MARPPARLVVFAGLPGTGKTTLARAIADELQASFRRIDTFEAAISQNLRHDRCRQFHTEKHVVEAVGTAEGGAGDEAACTATHPPGAGEIVISQR